MSGRREEDHLTYGAVCRLWLVELVHDAARSGIA